MISEARNKLMMTFILAFKLDILFDSDTPSH